MSNLDLWDSVQETNPADTKPVSFGRKFTAIDAYSQIKKATEIFGSYGGEWGIRSIVHTFIPNTNMVMGEAQFVYKLNEKTKGAFPVTSSILYISEKGKVDDEFAKKLETDMITKALSRLGFNADVFMGRFDDNRYVAQMKQKFEQMSPQPINQGRVDGCYDMFMEVMREDVDNHDFARMQNGYNRLTNDEQIAVFGKIGTEKIPNSRKGYKALAKDLLAMSEADNFNPDSGYNPDLPTGENP